MKNGGEFTIIILIAIAFIGKKSVFSEGLCTMLVLFKEFALAQALKKGRINLCNLCGKYIIKPCNALSAALIAPALTAMRTPIRGRLRFIK